MKKKFEEPEKIKILIKAAEEGNLKSQYELGKYYYKNFSLEIDYLKKGIYLNRSRTLPPLLRGEMNWTNYSFTPACDCIYFSIISIAAPPVVKIQ